MSSRASAHERFRKRFALRVSRSWERRTLRTLILTVLINHALQKCLLVRRTVTTLLAVRSTQFSPRRAHQQRTRYLTNRKRTIRSHADAADYCFANRRSRQPASIDEREGIRESVSIEIQATH